MKLTCCLNFSRREIPGFLYSTKKAIGGKENVTARWVALFALLYIMAASDYSLLLRTVLKGFAGITKTKVTACEPIT